MKFLLPVFLLITTAGSIYAQDATAEDKATLAMIEAIDHWQSIFDGKTLEGWQGDTVGYQVVDGAITCLPKKGRNLYTKKEYTDFVLDFEFKLTPGANNGLGVRYPGSGDAAYVGLELQILDNTAEKYAKLKEWQYHGSVYGIQAAKRGHLKPVGEWNRQQVISIGDHIKIILNDEVIVDTYLNSFDKLPNGKTRAEHKGMQRKGGYIAFCGHGDEVAYRALRVADYSMGDPAAKPAGDNTPPKGFTAQFNGKDLAGWKGLVADPKKRNAMTPEALAEAQKGADEQMNAHWSVRDGVLHFDGKGKNLCTAEKWGDFEVYVDWKIPANADSGLYLRGAPQVQIWDPANEGQWKHGADKGSGGLWNNKKAGRDPLVKADNPIGEWNTFFIRMVGERVTIYLNGKLIIDDVVLENYWERDKPIYRAEQFELQNHGQALQFKNVFVRHLPW